jgi:hypothetical protein
LIATGRAQLPASHDQYWLSSADIISPDGSPMTIIAMSVNPSSFATVTGGPGKWGLDFLQPGANMNGTVTLTVQNGAGTSTISFYVWN